ncbi:hypothetical protein MSAN_01402300 [Mycena sanguinolenta]|uniref:Uncharacterized protein n=1 Tax=Mycena sanguinolenta TaxID=230812 RepID=A0A8H6Y7X8_9AGAR|nr:hypothetical protein MSAN_01402300 [Mycena sanguinolenta]
MTSRLSLVSPHSPESRDRVGIGIGDITTSFGSAAMGKRGGPTLAQRLLGQPSQKYTMPAPKHYYSERPALMRIAHTHETPTLEQVIASRQPSIRDDDDDDDDTFYTPRSSFASDTMTVTTPPTSDNGHALYTDQDWANDLEWLAKAMQKPKPKRIPMPPQQPPQRVSRSPTPSIMMSMTALLEEDEDGPPLPPKHTPRSSVIISSRSSTPPPVVPHRRARSVGTTANSLSYHPPSPLSGPPELPSYGTPAYTSLVVPPAPSTLSLTRSTSISQRLRAPFRRATADLSRSRLAQANMASIEVVGGLASPSQDQPPRLGFTHYRTPPSVSKASVLVQVWAVGLDVVDLRLLGVHSPARPEYRHTRTQSFGRFVGRTINRRTASDVGSICETNKDKDSKEPGHPPPPVGFIPGRSFVGRVLECGWEVRDEVARRGEWVVGLLDIRKSGALAEFITVDRHRIHRLPRPLLLVRSGESAPTPAFPSAVTLKSRVAIPLASLFRLFHPRHTPALATVIAPPTPACQPPFRPSPRPHHPHPASTSRNWRFYPFRGSPRTVSCAPSRQGPWTPPVNGAPTWSRLTATLLIPWTPCPKKRALAAAEKAKAKGKRRALVLHGHAGTGGLVACMLARRGWRVCIHAPGSVSETDDEEADKEHMRRVQERARAWGVEEVVFDDGGCAADNVSAFGSALDARGRNGAAVRAVERLITDGDEFDAVVDTIGGKAVWDVGERLLARGSAKWRKQFTTTVGDWPIRPVPTAKDNFRAGLRALTGGNGAGDDKKSAKKTTKESKEKAGSTVSYAWVSAAQDVDWEGEDVRDSLGAVLRIALEEGVRPIVEGDALPFERAGEVLEGRAGNKSAGILKGGNVCVRVVG